MAGMPMSAYTFGSLTSPAPWLPRPRAPAALPTMAPVVAPMKREGANTPPTSPEDCATAVVNTAKPNKDTLTNDKIKKYKMVNK
eukprot:833409-Pyramimonas_sp.AAC.1